MKENRLPDYLNHMQEAASEACLFVQGMSQAEFQQDRRTQQAVVMSLIILGEAAAKVMDNFPQFTQTHTQLPWHNMRGMRNRIAHGYFDIDLEVVWNTVQMSLPHLLEQLQALRPLADAPDQS